MCVRKEGKKAGRKGKKITKKKTLLLLAAVDEPLLHGRDRLIFIDALLYAGDLYGARVVLAGFWFFEVKFLSFLDRWWWWWWRACVYVLGAEKGRGGSWMDVMSCTLYSG